MNRRKFLLATIATSLSSALWAAPEIGTFSGQGDVLDDKELIRQFKPYVAIGNFKDDAHRVFMFISFDCPYCASTWVGFGQWAVSLPKPYKFVYVPIFASKAQNVAGTAFYVVRELTPQRTPEFMRQAFALQQMSTSKAEQYIDILHKMGFSRQQVADAVNKEITQNRIARAITLYERYKVSVTPSFGVAGKYYTHTGFTRQGTYKEVGTNLSWLITNEIEKTS